MNTTRRWLSLIVAIGARGPCTKMPAVLFALVGLAAGIAASAVPAHAGDPAFTCAVAKQRAALQELDAINACVRKGPETGDADVVEDLVGECGVGLALLLPGRCQPAGASCGGSNPLCCPGLACGGQIGHPPTCG